MVWDPGTAAGLGPLPGLDPLEAARIVLSELPLPNLAELPARGVGADPVGRTASLLADLHVEVGTGVWRFVPRGGRDEQRARTALTTDLDALEEVADGYDGPLKVRIVGPWSLAASIELPRGEKALADPGAVRDIAASLTEGLTHHLADIRRRVPALTRLVVQVDEPLLPAVVAGELSTASGWGRLRSYERSVVEDGLRQVGGHEGVGRRPVGSTDDRRLEPVGGVFRHALLEERRTARPLGEPLQQHRPAPHGGHQRLPHGFVVADEVELRLSPLREEHLVGARDAHLAPVQLQDRLFGLGRHTG